MAKVNVNAPKTIQRFLDEGRGQGIGSEYQPWLQVRRGELKTHGLASLNQTKDGPKHFLSNVERVAFLCATVLPGYLETKEQHPLSLDPDQHEITQYTGKYEESFVGTRQVALELGVKHRRPAGPYTTDLVITFKINNDYELLAIACKGSGPLTKREIELLLVEKVYWEKRGVKWILVTPELYTRTFANIMSEYAGLAFRTLRPLDVDLMQQIIAILATHKVSYTDLYLHFSSLGYEMGVFQKTFWYGYFRGHIPMEVLITFNSMKEIRLIDPDAFLDQNPIFNRRSAWKY